MKAQRRHELHQNILADWLAKQLEVVKPYTTWILGGVIALCAAAIVVQLINGSGTNQSGANWTKYFIATATSDTDEKIKLLAAIETANNSASLWAHLAQADLRLEQATAKAYNDREASKKALEEAKSHYQKVVDGSTRQPMLLHRGQFGLAQAYETGNDFEKAKEIYEALEKSAPESVYGKSAGLRLKRLGSTDLKTFSTMLAAHKPVEPQKRSPGLDGMGGMHGLGGLGGMGGLGGPGGMPDFGAPLPERPDLSLPGPSLDFPSNDKPDAEKTEDPAKTPADPEKKPEDSEKKPTDPEKKPEDPEKKPAEPEKKGDEPEKKPAEPEKKTEDPDKKPAEPEKKPEGETP